MNNIKITFLILIAISIIIITPMLTGEAYARHTNNSVGQPILEFEEHIWSRTAEDSHRGYLNCGTGTDINKCNLKIKVYNSIQSITKTQVENEVDTIETDFDALNKNMSIDRVTTADSIIQRYGLDPTYYGFTEYELHCTNPGWFWTCNGKDMHFKKMMVQINDDANEIKFGSSEDSTANPQIYDVRKTLGHELFHAIGVDHNSIVNSIVYDGGYQFGSTNGYDANIEDKADLAARYP